MDKRIVLKEFTVEAEIFHMDLPEKVAKVLTSDGFTPKQDLYYRPMISIWLFITFISSTNCSCVFAIELTYLRIVYSKISIA